jgi:alkanesulfonate monooxygenase SsuD/methylene tetrahydromethanopterin reductase-like flavin-dependent oxidoreductase (luciferase family)
MKIFLMDLLPYGRHFEEFKADRFMPYPLPRSYFEAGIAARTYEEHFQIWDEMDQLGFDGVGLNEHHTTPHGLMNSPNMIAAAAARTTKRLKFFILGNLVPLHNPLRIAEELAMADCISRGRVLAGFARGVPREYRVYDVKMSDSRARFEEGLDIIRKAWTEETFSHDGRFFKYTDISIWPRPYQQPHPPIWVPFTGSKETIEWAARNNFSAVLPDFKPGVVEDIVGHYSRHLAKVGHQNTPEKMCLFTDAWVAASEAEAIKEYGPYYLYFNQTLWHHGSAPAATTLSQAGYVASTSYDYIRPENRADAEIDRSKIRAMGLKDVEEKVSSGRMAWGSAPQVTERLVHAAERAGVNALLLNMNLGAPPFDLFLEQIRRFGREVLPKLQSHQVTTVPGAVAIHE